MDMVSPVTEAVLVTVFILLVTMCFLVEDICQNLQVSEDVQGDDGHPLNFLGLDNFERLDDYQKIDYPHNNKRIDGQHFNDDAADDAGVFQGECRY